MKNFKRDVAIKYINNGKIDGGFLNGGTSYMVSKIAYLFSYVKE
ncbi:hypothetical protein [Metabacillus niabensis]|nr:hypothetical protein [Metabacillus niabensis]